MSKDIFKTPFEDAYNEFKDSRLSINLSNKFKPKPFFKKYFKLKIFALIGSILFSCLSALTAFSFVFLLCNSMNFGFYAALTIAVVALLALELGKRFTIEPVILDLLKLKKVRFGLLLVFVGLSAMSIYSSFEGSKLAVNELSDNSDIVNIDSLESANRAKIETINTKIGEYKNDKQYRNSDGVIFYNVSAKLIPKLEGQIITQTSINTAAVDSANVYNSNSNATHQASNKSKGISLGYLTILSELLLILCLSFVNFYDYRSYIEMATMESQYTPTNDVYTPNPPVYTDEVKNLARRKIDADITTYQNKIKNKVGKKETNEKRIRELELKKASISQLNTV